MTPIYVKTVYSFLSSLITIDDLIDFAKTNNLDSLCICDDNMYSVIEFIRKCEKNNINPIVGLDIDKCLLYAKDYNGYLNLLKILTIKSERELTIDDLKEYSDSLICFINYQEEEKELLKEIYPDNYLYSEEESEYLYLPKVLCLKKEDVDTLRYFNMLRDGKKISDEYSFNNDCYYKDINNSIYNEIINKCHLVLPKYKLNIPLFCKYNDTKGLDSDEYLYNLAITGLNKRLDGKVTTKYKDRLLYELDVIKKMGFSNYFLIVYDFIKYAKGSDILVGPGRGSAAGSLVSYSLGITEVDPIKYDLLFERFLNIERITMPDIDTDFPDDKRDLVIDYVINKYGKKNVSLISTFNTFGSKMALRDMGRVMNVQGYIIDDLIKKIGTMSLVEAYENISVKNTIHSDNKIKKLYEVAIRIEGLPRNASVHAAGVIMANTPLDNIIPLIFSDGRYLSAYEAVYLEELGLLKMDFLGIRNLTILDNTLKLINKYNKNTNLKFRDIPLNDELTNKLFCNGDTLGIFQFEKNGMRDFLRRLAPKNFMDIYNANAFYRPGPSDNIDLFIKRRHGLVKTTYFMDKLESVLKDTCGIIVYQEQIMQIANILSDFSLGEADILRRAMSKKKKEEIEKYKDKFINNAIHNGYDKDIVLNIYNLILNFASYGFNKSHSVAYSMISYKMAYLKANYPIYFYLLLLTGSMFDDEKIISYIKEMRKKNIKVLKPDINKSMEYFTIYYDSILLPFGIIKGIGIDISRKIIEVRGDGFRDIYEFFMKVEGIIPKNIMELLIKSGSLDSFGYTRKTLIMNIDSLINYSVLCKDLGMEFVLKPEITSYEEYEKDLLINNEKIVFGFYLTNHPVSFYKNKISSINLIDIKKYFNKKIKCVVMIDKINEITTKKGEKMAFLLCSDEESNCDVTIFPNVYKTLSNLEKNDIIIIEGKVERRNDFSIIADKIMSVKDDLK